ncbi:MAG: hypothetical protein ABWZ25_08825 [Chitinophagaceae bacterium]
MKKILIITLTVITCVTSQAQTVAEWTQQRKTQLKYLLNQIASLRVHVQHVQEGYRILDRGLEAIGSIKRSDFNLHEQFFAELTTVNPVIRNHSAVGKILYYQTMSMKHYKKDIRRIRASSEFSTGELQHIDVLYGRLLESSDDCLNNLIDVVTDQSLTLSDDERLKRLVKLERIAEETCNMIRVFGQENLVLVLNRKQEQREILMARKNYDLVQP